MKAYGYEKKKVSGTHLLELREVTLSGSPASLRDVARFLAKAAEEKEKRSARFNHMHIREVCPDWLEKWPDIIVSE